MTEESEFDPGMIKNFLHVIQTGSWACSAFYTLGTQGVKQLGSEADHSPSLHGVVLN
jgi:hypothetical protein